jgi:hypothetical protein
MENEKSQKVGTSLPPRSRLIAAGIVFISGFLSPLLIPLVTSSAIHSGWKVTLAGLLAFGIPELFMIIAACIAGKEGFQFIKSKIFEVFKYAVPDRVSKVRYKIGLVLFVIPLLLAWLLPYFAFHIPFYEDNLYLINALGDVMMLVSLFVLGGDFWDKLRSLFIQDARINYE